MVKIRKHSIKTEKQNGYIIPLCGVLLLVFFGISSLVIDIGNARYQLRNIQIGVDAASMAGLVALEQASGSDRYVSVRNEVYDIAARNRLSQSEITDIDCGIWNSLTQEFGSQRPNNLSPPVCNGSTNAIKVTTSRQVNTFFGRILGTNTIIPATSATASRQPAKECMKPFGIYREILNGLSVGAQFTIGTASPGNWGKLNIGDYMSNGQNFSMDGDVCHEEVGLNQVVYNQTGSSGVKAEFNRILGSPDADDMVIALTTAFANGSSGNVTILEFVKLDLIASGGNGNNWTGTFRIVERNILPNPNPANFERKLVR